MNHDHAYSFSHIHSHEHRGEDHEHRHSHFYAMVHEHGNVKCVHSHKTKFFHPDDNDPAGGYKKGHVHHGKAQTVTEYHHGEMYGAIV